MSLQHVQLLEVQLAITVTKLGIFLETAPTRRRRRPVTNVVTKVISQETVLNLLPYSAAAEEGDTEEVVGVGVDTPAEGEETATNATSQAILRETALREVEEEEKEGRLEATAMDPVEVEGPRLAILVEELAISRVTASRQRNVSIAVKMDI